MDFARNNYLSVRNAKTLWIVYGVGIQGTLEQMAVKKIPKFICMASYWCTLLRTHSRGL